MEQWNNRVKNSPAYLQSVELMRIVTELKTADHTPQIKDYLDRVELVVDLAIERLNNSDPRLINTGALANLGNSMTNAVANINAWINGSGDNYLTSAVDSEMDTAVTWIIGLVPTLDVPEARESIASLRRSVAAHRTIVDKLVDEIKAKGSVADKSIDAKVEEVTAGFNKIQLEVADLDSDLATIKTASTTVTTEQQTAFTKAEADRTAKFAELLSSQQQELGVTLGVIEEQAKSSVEEIQKKVSADETKATEARERIEEILGIVGEESLVGDYSKNAIDEKKVANYWRYGAVASIAVAIGVAAHFAGNVSDTTTWQFVVAKTLIVLSFGGLAGYAGRQSTEHRLAQRDAERMALQLKALKPYLLDMDDKVGRDKLLASIADKLFGNIQQPVLSGKKGDNPQVTAQLIEALLEIVKRSKDI